ncbi:crystal protein isoform X1 [Archocentrus centrarchus]|uniref:crystal protein isoform X1 n=1 Tax=Archocentrus centrarchus TaxID=63155 RepID=UPI0011EA3734|nr:crystal protein-like isoform X1 [Archocentrus centrarchus]
MENWHCLLLLCTLSLVLYSGGVTKNDDDIDLVSFLRNIYPGLLVRDESFINQDFKPNFLKELGPQGDDPAITQQTKDKPVTQDTDGAAGPVVLTKDGQIQGITLDKAHVFYGIPYADPPVGAYRWKPPRPVSPWQGVYDASFPRAACMQFCSRAMTEDCPKSVSEDCLYLNIFIPLDVDFSSPLRSHLPVMVWIHGGDFIAGSASKPLYDGRFISNFTHSVVVNLEYRLGAFGFLVSGKDPQTSAAGNYGILDQQAALLWVQQNIAMFGGDPSKVTVFGESAGAQSVSLHLMIQSSNPLFKQAILQSLPFSIPLKTRHDALKLGKDFAKQTNCSASDFVCLLSLTPQAVLAAQMKTSTTSEEGVLFVYGVFNKPVSAVECTVYITAIFKQHTLRILHKYMPLYRDADHRNMLAQIVTDFVFLCPSRRSARAGTAEDSKVWMYVFDHVISDHRIWSGLTFCYQHSCHGAELPFLFHSASVANFTLSPSEKLLSNRMLCYWGAFAHTGDPSSRAQQTTFCQEQRLPVWPLYSDTSSWLVMNFTVRSHAQVGTRNHICDFWDQLGIY